MSADLSRQRFDPLKNLSGVLEQQGRVQLDADWNEFVEILDRRFRAETTDIIGRCVVPRETPDGFKIAVSGNDLNIGPGRIYVDGLLAENHGDAPAMFDAVLGELRGSNPVLYSKQPYLPSAKIADLTQPAPLLVYIDVWQREVTFIEDPDLVEKAVGVDTTARLQTVWQVRILPNVGSNATCSSDIQAWNDLIAPSAGRLTTAAHGVPSTIDPCLIPPTGGYLGLENQLYRVEIHDVDLATGNATFKWSRDNASVATNITGVDTTGTLLTVDSVGRDSVLCFKANHWVEITDDVREFDRKPGIMRKVLSVGDKTITLGTPLTGADLPNLLQHARVKRWDQSGNVVDTNDGVIPVPAPGTSLLLENGVEVTFSLDPPGGKFHAGDYWVFAARTADASVEQLSNAAPRGIHHHYGRLAIVTFPGPTRDCRILWPPEECCDCSVCVSAESHNNGTFTIQQAIDKIKDVGGTICLGPGLYLITSANPVRIDGARSIRLKGQSWLTILFSMEEPGVVISNSLRVTVEDLSVVAVSRSDFAGLAVSIVNSTAVTLQRCAIVQWGFELNNAGGRSGAAIGLSGFVMETRICDNVMYGADGIAGVGQHFEPGLLVDSRLNLTALLRIDDNCIFASGTGINFDASFLHLAEHRMAGNFIAGCKSAGIGMRGIVLPGGLLGSRLDIHGNDVSTAGHGIVISTSQTRITDNDISSSLTLSPDEPRNTSLNAGILLLGREGNRIEQCQILENRINRMGSFGISLAAQIGSAMIKQNIIDGAGLGGIVMDLEGQASAEVLTIENNQISNVAAGFNGEGASLLGIWVSNAKQTTIAGNTVIGVGLVANSAGGVAGIAVKDSNSARIAGNTVYDIAPVSKAVEGSLFRFGIVVAGAIGRVDVLDNDVNRNRASAPERANDRTSWLSLLILEKITNTPIDQSQTVVTSQDRFVFINGIILRFPRGPETIGVRGNILDGYGSIRPIWIESRGACLFGDNRCNFVPATNSSPPIAEIACEAIIVNANFFQTSPNDKTVLLKGDIEHITVLGNIASGLIWINNNQLGSPWAPLNIMF